MKLGVFNPVLRSLPFEEACTYFENYGIQMVEIGCGGFPGKSHCDPQVLLQDDEKCQEFQNTLKRHHLEISALSCHGNPLHPNKETAKKFDDDLTDAILMCEKLGVEILNTFSGCPGSDETALKPNWVTCSWPEDFSEILEWQWEEVLIPYWKQKAAFAKEHGVDKIALELHPGFCVYNTKSLLRLRNAVGPEIGANLDPSHLIWQQMDPVEVIRVLGNEHAIFHFHAKDTQIHPYNCRINGVLDTTHYADSRNRSWTFRSIGYGHDLGYWKDIISALRMAGYDHSISIEHEDGLMSPNEGLVKTIEALKQCMMFEDPGEMYWA
ncbi:MAG TPA: sugar phosphate isomerase/epimerase [Lachnospiraceae bacterium]|nr:sugar phosphate isomerase/epimerase [Lachnospiraceae bacterium]